MKATRPEPCETPSWREDDAWMVDQDSFLELTELFNPDNIFENSLDHEFRL